MIAIIASAFLGLYVFLPVVIFDKTLSAFVPAKRLTRNRTEEIAFGLVVAAIPLFCAFILAHLFWFVGHYPFPLNEIAEKSAGSDYKSLIMALQSDKYLNSNEARVWLAAEHVKWRQLRFLSWTYLLLAIQCSAFTALVCQYGRLKKYKVYRIFSKIFIVSVSEWHILLTDYLFDPAEHTLVHVDIVTKSALYAGAVGRGKYFFKADGTLSGLLLSGAKRFRKAEFDEDRKNNCAKETSCYWTLIAGAGQLYLPVEEISNINIRYVISEEKMVTNLQKQAEQMTEIKALLAKLGKEIQIQVDSGKKDTPPTPPL